MWCCSRRSVWEALKCFDIWMIGGDQSEIFHDNSTADDADSLTSRGFVNFDAGCAASSRGFPLG